MCCTVGRGLLGAKSGVHLVLHGTQKPLHSASGSSAQGPTNQKTQQNITSGCLPALHLTLCCQAQRAGPKKLVRCSRLQLVLARLADNTWARSSSTIQRTPQGASLPGSGIVGLEPLHCLLDGLVERCELEVG